MVMQPTARRAANPQVFNLTIQQGNTFHLPITLRGPNGAVLDLTGWQLKAQIRARGPGGALVAELVIQDPHLPDGKFSLHLDAAVTAAMTPGTIGVWDLRSTDASGTVRTLLTGSASVRASVTV